MKKITVISGGAGGLGKAAARELGKYSVVVLGDRNHDQLLVTKKELAELGVEIFILQLDVSVTFAQSVQES